MTRIQTTHPSLLERLRDRDDQGSWRVFQAQYGHLLYRYARGRGASHADAEDVAQEVVMQFVRAAPGFRYDRSRGRFRGYLRAAVIREMARRARRDRRRPVALGANVVELLAVDRGPGRGSDDDVLWRTEWWLGRLRWATARIAGEFDAVTLKAFEMHVLAACPVAETATKLGISKWRIYRARRKILRRLAIELGEGGRNDETARHARPPGVYGQG